MMRSTEVDPGARDNTYVVRRFAVVVASGPDRGARAESVGDQLSIGVEVGNDLQLTDPSVSRHHLVIRATPRGLELRDLDSTNGTFVANVDVVRGYLASPARISIGRTTLSLELSSDENVEPLAESSRYGQMLGASTTMRRMFALLDRYAASDATVLIIGETGTGKELVARELHDRSGRRAGPFVIVDCGALPRTLLESELFGHKRGAFTGAEDDRIGAFEAADGGTLVLDEIGELPPELQPVLLRFAETRRFRPIGDSRDRQVDVRIIASTNRDLRVDVNHGRFRSDLFFRLNVLRVDVPPLRDREGDPVLLGERFWQELSPGSSMPAEVRRDIAASPWPGNVRELRNAIERACIRGWEEARDMTEPSGPALGFADSKDVAVVAWERTYLTQLLARVNGNLSQAARVAKMSRSHLRMLMQRHGIERVEFTD